VKSSGFGRVGLIAVLMLALIRCAGTGRSGSVSLPEAPESVQGFSALCFARWRGEEGSGHARLTIAYLAPDRIRMEVLDPLGNSRAVLVARSDGALLLEPSQRAYRQFSSSVAASTELVGLAASPQILARLILGPSVPLVPAGCEALSEAEPAQEGCTPQGIGRVAIAQEGPGKGRLDSEEGVHLDLRWGGQASTPRSLPQWIEIHQEKPPLELRLETREARFVLPDPELFSLTAPAGFAPAMLESGRCDR
jgi:hypothetical protein